MHSNAAAIVTIHFLIHKESAETAVAVATTCSRSDGGGGRSLWLLLWIDRRPATATCSSPTAATCITVTNTNGQQKSASWW